MRKASIIAPLLALAAGIFGYYLRRTELASVFDPMTGLPARGSIITQMLVVLTLCLLLFSFIFSIAVRKNIGTHGNFAKSFGVKKISYPISLLIISSGWLTGAVTHFLNAKAAVPIPIIEVYLSVLAAVSAVAIIVFSFEIYRDPTRGSARVLSVVPPLFMSFWLILLYKRNAANPILLNYGYQCLAIICSALGFYFTSGYVFSKAAPGKAVFSYLTSIYFSCVAFADSGVEMRLIFAACAAIHLIHCSMLLGAAKKTPD